MYRMCRRMVSYADSVNVNNVLGGSPVRNSFRFLSVSDSRASNTAAPISRYVKVQTTSDRVLTFWRFISSWDELIDR